MKQLKILSMTFGILFTQFGVSAAGGGGFYPRSNQQLLEQVQRLIREGANLNQADGQDGTTPLIRASSSGYANVVIILLENGADANATTTTHQLTPLHLAAYYGNVECMNILLSFGANVNARDCDGITPLHLAAEARSSDCVRALLEVGADASITRPESPTFFSVRGSVTRRFTALEWIEKYEYCWGDHSRGLAARKYEMRDHSETRRLLHRWYRQVAQAQNCCQMFLFGCSWGVNHPSLVKIAGSSHIRQHIVGFAFAPRTTDPLPQDAIVIQKLTRGHLARKNLREMQKNGAATKIQALIRGMLERESLITG